MKVVLLPGLDGTGKLFKPFIDALPPDVDPLVISYPADKKLSYEELTDLVISHLPDERFILLGESFSGYIAYNVALRKPRHLQSVIYAATFLENPRPLLLAVSEWLPRRYLLSLTVPDFIVKKYLLGFTADRDLVDLFKRTIGEVSPEVLSFRLEEIAGLPKKLQSCGVRAIYLQASDDELIPQNAVNRFMKVCSDLKVLRLKGPHFIMQVNAQASAAVVVHEIASLN